MAEVTIWLELKTREAGKVFPVLPVLPVLPVPLVPLVRWVHAAFKD